MEKQTKVYKGREIESLLEDLSDYEQFTLLPKYDDLEEDQKGSESSLRIHQTIGLISPGNKVHKGNLDDKCILHAFDKAGLSMVLDLPVPPGATFEANLSTWISPCDGAESKIEPTLHFGVGVVPMGTATEQNWPREGFSSSIENGLQFYSELNMTSLLGGGSGGWEALLAGRGGNLVEHTITVYENGTTKHHGKGKLGLAPINVTVTRELTGDSKIQIKQGHLKYTIGYKKEKEDPEDLQLYVNCLNWPDNMIYVRFDDVTLTKPVDSGNQKRKAVEDEAPLEQGKKDQKTE
jgi:hypothetical protein